MKKLTILLVLIFAVFTFGQMMVIEFSNGDVIRFEASEIASIYFENEKPVNVFEAVAGVWKGDKGLDFIEIFDNGIAVVTCINGFSWTATVDYNNGQFEIKSPYPISKEYYENYFSKKISERLSEEVQVPDSWAFELSSNSTELIGKKNSIQVYHTGDTISSWNYFERESTWTRNDSIANYIRPIVGTWKGDKGLDTIDVYANGTGIVKCENGYSWRVMVEYKNGYFVFKTPMPAPIGYNTNYFSENISEQLAERVEEPNTWTFKLSSDNMRLEGRKTIQSIRYTGDVINSLENKDREAIWERVY